MSRIVSLVALVAVLLVVGVLSYKVMAGFLLPMFLAVLLVVIFRPLHQWFVARFRGYDRLAAVATTVSILLIVLVPILLILGKAAAEAYALTTDKVQQEAAKQQLTKFSHWLGLDMPLADIQPLLEQFQRTLGELRVRPALEKLPNEKTQEAGTIEALEGQARTIRARLGLDGPPVAGDPAADRRAELTARWKTLFDKIELLKQAKPGTPDFETAQTEVGAAFDAFRDEVLGSPFRRWVRGQLIPGDDQQSNIVAKVQQYAGPLVLGTGQFLGSLLIGMFVMVISLYYFLADGPAMIRTLMRLSPLDDRYETQLLNEFATVSRAVVVATLLSAFAQGLLASIGYFFADFDSVFLLTVLTMFLAMVPFVGAAGVWGGCALWLYFVEGRMGAAIGLAIYGAVVVSMIDNLIKPLVLHGQSSLHPLLALLSVLGGVTALGPIGIFVGPMGVAFLQALLNMLHTELVAMDQGEKTAAPAQT